MTMRQTLERQAREDQQVVQLYDETKDPAVLLRHLLARQHSLQSTMAAMYNATHRDIVEMREEMSTSLGQLRETMQETSRKVSRQTTERQVAEKEAPTKQWNQQWEQWITSQVCKYFFLENTPYGRDAREPEKECMNAFLDYCKETRFVVDGLPSTPEERTVFLHRWAPMVRDTWTNKRKPLSRKFSVMYSSKCQLFSEPWFREVSERVKWAKNMGPAQRAFAVFLTAMHNRARGEMVMIEHDCDMRRHLLEYGLTEDAPEQATTKWWFMEIMRATLRREARNSMPSVAAAPSAQPHPPAPMPMRALEGLEGDGEAEEGRGAAVGGDGAGVMVELGRRPRETLEESSAKRRKLAKKK